MSARDKAPSEGAPRKAKVFWTGRSQAVRLPKDLRFETDEVLIRREGRCVILEPIDDWGDAFWSCFGALDDDFEIPDRDDAAKRDDPFA